MFAKHEEVEIGADCNEEESLDDVIFDEGDVFDLNEAYVEQINEQDLPPIQHVDETSRSTGGEEDVVEIDIDGQNERITILFLTIGFVLCLQANALLLYWKPNNKNDVIINQVLVESPVSYGMPVPHLAMFGDAGYVESFSIFENTTVKDFPNLPHAEITTDGDNYFSNLPYYQIFAAAYKNIIYFLTCNPEKMVTKVEMDKNGHHETIPGSKIPNSHFMVAQGVQVGNYYWILGGYPLGSGFSFSFGKC